MSSFRQFIPICIIKIIQQFGPHKVTVLGRMYEISKDVFNPKYYFTSQFMAKNMTISEGDTVLDIGTGSGILAITAGLNASKVIAIDINPEAVKYARKNVKANNLERIVSVLEGDLFSPLGQTMLFDTILFTPPYMEGEPRTGFEYALFDKKKQLLKRFFRNAAHYLKPGGYVQMLYSSIAEPDLTLDISMEFGWKYSVIAHEKTFSESFSIYKLYVP
ncbi:MAG: tRNA (adenine(22)-N(1))-methyltransferase TrmK [Nitrospiraceae bacterium]|nr:MAG: tRNA (adenine(22)-N(1))-methyltransferase TrmK [Nitrospiraceae bacterium]